MRGHDRSLHAELGQLRRGGGSRHDCHCHGKAQVASVDPTAGHDQDTHAAAQRGQRREPERPIGGEGPLQERERSCGVLQGVMNDLMDAALALV